MAKKKEVTAVIKLQCPGGQATPAPPVGPALGQHGVNIGQFVQKFNDVTKKLMGVTVPCKIFVYKDKSFDMQTFSPPASVLLKQAAGIAKGAADPLREKVGEVNRAQLEDIVKQKSDVLDAKDVDHAVRIIAGTARSMGIKVVD